MRKTERPEFALGPGKEKSKSMGPLGKGLFLERKLQFAKSNGKEPDSSKEKKIADARKNLSPWKAKRRGRGPREVTS